MSSYLCPTFDSSYTHSLTNIPQPVKLRSFILKFFSHISCLTLPHSPVHCLHELLNAFRARRLRAKSEGGHEVRPVSNADDESECQPREHGESSRCGVQAPLSEVLSQEGLVDLQESFAEVGIPVASETVHLLRGCGVYG